MLVETRNGSHVRLPCTERNHMLRMPSSPRSRKSAHNSFCLPVPCQSIHFCADRQIWGNARKAELTFCICFWFLSCGLSCETEVRRLWFLPCCQKCGHVKYWCHTNSLIVLIWNEIPRILIKLSIAFELLRIESWEHCAPMAVASCPFLHEIVSRYSWFRHHPCRSLSAKNLLGRQDLGYQCTQVHCYRYWTFHFVYSLLACNETCQEDFLIHFGWIRCCVSHINILMITRRCPVEWSNRGRAEVNLAVVIFRISIGIWHSCILMNHVSIVLDVDWWVVSVTLNGGGQKHNVREELNFVSLAVLQPKK